MTLLDDMVDDAHVSDLPCIAHRVALAMMDARQVYSPEERTENLAPIQAQDTGNT